MNILTSYNDSKNIQILRNTTKYKINLMIVK